MNLIEAVEAGDIELVKSLLDEDGKNGALVFAVRKGHKKIVKILLDRGADAKNKQALEGAALYGHEEIVKILLDNGADTKNSEALLYATRKGHTRIVKILLDSGADDEVKNIDALRSAAAWGHKEIVKILLNHGVDINAEVNDHKTVLESAAGNGHREIVEILLNKGADVKAGKIGALFSAALSGHEEIVKILLDKGANAKQSNSAALRVAAGNGHERIIEILLDHGADAKAENSEALESAAENGHERIVKILLDRGADVKEGNNGALRFAALRGHERIVKTLLNYGADINAKVYGETALESAAKIGNQRVVKVLLDYFDKIDSSQKALEFAFKGYHYNVVKEFVIVGAFTIQDITRIKACKNRILDASSQAEKITVLANLIAVAYQEDEDFIKNTFNILKVLEKEINTVFDTENFRIREKGKISKDLQILKAKTKVIDLTKEILGKLWNKVAILIPDLKSHEDKISEVLTFYISKEKFTKDLSKKVLSNLDDNDLEKAFPYKHTLEVLESILQQKAATDDPTSQPSKMLKQTPQEDLAIDAIIAEDNAVVLGDEEATKNTD